MCILLYMKLIWCSGITLICGQLEEGAWYMCILLYMKCIWCSGITQICGQLEEGALAYVHYSICVTYWVQWYCRDLSLIGVRSICHGQMCVLLYMKLICCSGFAEINGQLEEGALVYVHSSICETYLVQWYCINLCSIGGGSICHGQLCILLYMNLIG